MEEREIRYKIPKPTPTIDKRTNKKGFKINDFSWYENGKRKKSDTKWHLTEEECVKEALDRIDNNADVVYNSAKMTVRGLITQYKEEVKKLPLTKCAPSTKKNRFTNSNALLKHLPADLLDTKLYKFDLSDLKKILKHLRKRATTSKGELLSDEYYYSLKNTISLILAFADDNDYFCNSLSRYTELQNYLQLKEKLEVAKSQKRKREFRYLKEEEFKRFAVACLYDTNNQEEIETEIFWLFNKAPKFNYKKIKKENMEFFIFFNCMMMLGTRTEECRVLEVSDLDFQANDNLGQVSITKAFTSDYFDEDIDEYLENMPTKTDGSKRIIPMRPQLRAFLTEYLIYLNKNNLPMDKLFPGSDHGYLAYKTINYKIKTTLKKAGMEGKHFSKHDFRRSCAMLLCWDLHANRDLITPYFGWKNNEMLDEVYAVYNEMQKAEEMQKELKEKGFFDEPANYFNAENGKITIGLEAKKPNDKYIEYYNDDKIKYRPNLSKKKTDQ